MKKYADLSFVRRSTGDGFNWWVIDPPSDYSDGWNFGEDLGLELMKWAQDAYGDGQDLGFILRSVAESQSKHRSRGASHCGAIYGFWSVVSAFAECQAQRTDFTATAAKYAAKRAASAAALAAELERERKDRRERAQHAARVRWAKNAA